MAIPRHFCPDHEATQPAAYTEGAKMNTIANADLGFGLPFGSDMPFLSQSPSVLMPSHKFFAPTLLPKVAMGAWPSGSHASRKRKARSAYVVYFLGVGSAAR